MLGRCDIVVANACEANPDGSARAPQNRDVKSRPFLIDVGEERGSWPT